MKIASKTAAFVLAALIFSTLTVLAVDTPKQLPDPDGKAADMTKPVQVYILLGQSNMVGAGKIFGEKNGIAPHAAW